MCPALMIEKLQNNKAALKNGLCPTEKLLLKNFCVCPNKAAMGFRLSLQ